jgi:hypothetical protein
MIEIPSKIEGVQYHLYKLEQQLKPIGYTIGGNWDYDSGYFDYKIADDGDGYQYLRVPFRAIEGQLDGTDCIVELNRPFLLAHTFQPGLDDHAHIGNFSASFNQFQEPADKDDQVKSKYIDIGQSLVSELEMIILGD